MNVTNVTKHRGWRAFLGARREEKIALISLYRHDRHRARPASYVDRHHRHNCHRIPAGRPPGHLHSLIACLPGRPWFTRALELSPQLARQRTSHGRRDWAPRGVRQALAQRSVTIRPTCAARGLVTRQKYTPWGTACPSWSLPSQARFVFRSAGRLLTPPIHR
jgi:hypothetical protein